jgi:hypothetical protein
MEYGIVRGLLKLLCHPEKPALSLAKGSRRAFTIISIVFCCVKNNFNFIKVSIPEFHRNVNHFYIALILNAEVVENTQRTAEKE